MKIDTENTHLVRLLRNGDKEVFSTIYQTYYRKLYAFAMQYLPPEDSEEVIQDTMLWLWENRSAIISEKSLHALLFTIVKNKCLNRLEQLDVHHKVHEKLYTLFEEKTLTSSDAYDLEELKQLFHKALAKLPEEQRLTFIQNRFKKMSYQDIADKEGISPKTVSYRITQSLKQLRIALQEFLPSK